MKRKLIQLSPSTQVVTLPRSWLKANKLKKGAELELTQQENKIIISTSSKKSNKEITISIKGLPKKLMWAKIDAAYTAGYDEITILTTNQDQTQYMTKVSRYFPGMMITNEKKLSVTLKDIGENNEQNIKKIVNRIFNMVISMIDDAIQNYEKKDWEKLSRTKYKDYVINSYISFCLRQINKFGYEPLSKTGVMYGYLKVVEILADKFAALLSFVGAHKLLIKKELPLIKKSKEMMKQVQRMHESFSQIRINTIEKERLDLEQAMIKTNPKIRHYFAEISSSFYDLEELESQFHI